MLLFMTLRKVHFNCKNVSFPSLLYITNLGTSDKFSFRLKGQKKNKDYYLILKIPLFHLTYLQLNIFTSFTSNQIFLSLLPPTKYFYLFYLQLAKYFYLFYPQLNIFTSFTSN